MTWEQIDNGGHSGYLYRAKIPGGWLVRYAEDVLFPNWPQEGELGGMGSTWTHSICFVPDPKHEWTNSGDDESPDKIAWPENRVRIGI